MDQLESQKLPPYLPPPLAHPPSLPLAPPPSCPLGPPPFLPLAPPPSLPLAPPPSLPLAPLPPPLSTFPLNEAAYLSNCEFIYLFIYLFIIVSK